MEGSYRCNREKDSNLSHLPFRLHWGVWGLSSAKAEQTERNAPQAQSVANMLQTVADPLHRVALPLQFISFMIVFLILEILKVILSKPIEISFDPTLL